MTRRESALDADSEGTCLASVEIYIDLFFRAISRHLQLAIFRGEDPGSAEQCLTIVAVFGLPEPASALASDNTICECVCVCLCLLLEETQMNTPQQRL